MFLKPLREARAAGGGRWAAVCLVVNGKGVCPLKEEGSGGIVVGLHREVSAVGGSSGGGGDGVWPSACRCPSLRGGSPNLRETLAVKSFCFRSS